MMPSFISVYYSVPNCFVVFFYPFLIVIEILLQSQPIEFTSSDIGYSLAAEFNWGAARQSFLVPYHIDTWVDADRLSEPLNYFTHITYSPIAPVYVWFNCVQFNSPCGSAGFSDVSFLPAVHMVIPKTYGASIYLPSELRVNPFLVNAKYI